MAIALRAARAADIAWAAELAQTPEVAFALSPHAFPELEAAMTDSAHPVHAELLVIEAPRERVGVVRLCLVNPRSRIGAIRTLMVDPARRGEGLRRQAWDRHGAWQDGVMLGRVLDGGGARLREAAPTTREPASWRADPAG